MTINVLNVDNNFAGFYNGSFNYMHISVSVILYVTSDKEYIDQYRSVYFYPLLKLH